MKSFGIAVLLLVGMSCGGDDDGGVIDGGPRADSGPGVDGGPRPDGSTDRDAGPGVDGGPRTDGGGGGCGSCPSGFSCTPAGYCANAAGVPAFGRIYVMVFENKNLTEVMGSSNAPYLNGLMSMYASATSYVGVTNPSLPNYIAMTSGDTWGIGCDCHPTGSTACSIVTCNVVLSNCNCHQDHEHIGDQLDAVGIEWRVYGEGMGTPCNPTDSGASHYAAKHIPFLYYDDVFGDSARCMARVRDYSDFAADLASGTYRFSYISPDLCNDMHDSCGGNAVMQGDAWAAANVPPILATAGFAAGGTDALFFVWDEESLAVGTVPIPFIVVSPLVESGVVTATALDHYSLLATWEDGLGVPRLENATSADPITDIWR